MKKQIKKARKNSDRASKLKGCIWLGTYLLLIPSAAHADGNTLAGILGQFATYLTGTIGSIVSGLAIVGTGFACFGLGKIPKSYFIAVVAGIGLIFGAGQLVTFLLAGS